MVKQAQYPNDRHVLGPGILADITDRIRRPTKINSSRRSRGVQSTYNSGNRYIVGCTTVLPTKPYDTVLRDYTGCCSKIIRC